MKTTILFQESLSDSDLVTVTAIQIIKDGSMKGHIKFYVAQCFIRKVYYYLKSSHLKCFVQQLLCNLKNVPSLITLNSIFLCCR